MEALTHNQLKMYLKQHGLKISGSKADLTKCVLSHARENAARDVLEDEESYNSCEDVQLQNQSQVILIRYEGTNAGTKQGIGVKVNFRLVGGEVRINFEPYFTHFPTPLQVIIAQSLTAVNECINSSSRLPIK